MKEVFDYVYYLPPYRLNALLCTTISYLEPSSVVAGQFDFIIFLKRKRVRFGHVTLIYENACRVSVWSQTAAADLPV